MTKYICILQGFLGGCGVGGLVVGKVAGGLSSVGVKQYYGMNRWPITILIQHTYHLLCTLLQVKDRQVSNYVCGDRVQ